MTTGRINQISDLLPTTRTTFYRSTGIGCTLLVPCTQTRKRRASEEVHSFLAWQAQFSAGTAAPRSFLGRSNLKRSHAIDSSLTAPVCHVFHTILDDCHARAQTDLIQPELTDSCALCTMLPAGITEIRDDVALNDNRLMRDQPISVPRNDCSSDYHAKPTETPSKLSTHFSPTQPQGLFRTFSCARLRQHWLRAKIALPLHTKIAFVHAVTVSATTPTTHQSGIAGHHSHVITSE